MVNPFDRVSLPLQGRGEYGWAGKSRVMEILDAIKPQSISGPKEGEGKTPSRSREAVSKKEVTSSDEPKEKSDRIQKFHEARTEQVAETIKDYMNAMQTDLKIQVHQETGKIMVKVISKEDGKVVREVPPEELLNLAAKMEDMMGILFDRMA